MVQGTPSRQKGVVAWAPGVIGKVVLSTGEEYPLTSRGLVLGRGSTNDIWINDPNISRQHLRFEEYNNRAAVRDLNSTNGTWVNGARVNGAQLLNPGDRLDLRLSGGQVITLHYVASPAVAVAQPQQQAATPQRVSPPPVGVPPARAGEQQPAPPPPPPLAQAGGVIPTELTPRGTLDIASADLFREQFTHLLAQGATRFLVDLSHTDYLDSTGLGTLVQLHREAHARGGALVLVAPTEAVWMIFELTNIHKVLRIAGNRAEGLATLARG